MFSLLFAVSGKTKKKAYLDLRAFVLVLWNFEKRKVAQHKVSLSNEFSCETCILKDFSVSKPSRVEILLFPPPKYILLQMLVLRKRVQTYLVILLS